MNNQQQMPEPERGKQQVANLHKTSLKME